MTQKINNISQSLIEYSFCLLFFLVPLIMTPFNYELFEYNKMMATYAFTVIIVGSWLIKMVAAREIKIARTPLDIPLLLFLASQIISTFLSIDMHVSVFGYYSRFNGGLLSIISYILLYYAFVTNFPKEKIGKLLKFTLASGVLISTYGILEHFGASPSCLIFTGQFNVDCWVQDVQNRVFATLGQPNWLAAYLAVLIPLIMAITIIKTKNHNLFIVTLYHCFIVSFFSTLLFTKSRSGFIAFAIANTIFWLILLLKLRKKTVKPFLILNSLFLILVFIFGTPFSQINRFTLPELTKNNLAPRTYNLEPTKPTGSSIIEVGITESGKIRSIVWKGAIEIFKHYPLFGSGVETFAFSYYKFRPIEHNMTSEWDFLYNKAHNEYLNYAATTGAFGLGSYLLLILCFIWWITKRIRNYELGIMNIYDSKITNNPTQNPKSREHYSLFIISLFAAYSSILITNFFGFSVVIVQLSFYLIPAISFVLAGLTQPFNHLAIYPFNHKTQAINKPTVIQYVLIIILLFLVCYLLFSLLRFWYADTLFAKGFHASKSEELISAYSSIRDAISLNDKEPFYYDELSLPAAQLAVALSQDTETTTSAQLTRGAILASDTAITISPNNVNFWKTRTRVFYALAQEDEKYYQEAYESLVHARDLSPTDPKIRYNLAVLLEGQGKSKEAINEFREVTILKPDYRDAYLALAYLYQSEKQKDKAKEMLEFILTRLNPNDEEAKKAMEELK